MKIAVQILSTLKEPSTRNIDAIKRTYVAYANYLAREKKLKNIYDFYFYYGGYENELENTAVEPDATIEHCFDVKIPLEESIYNTFEKGIEALKVAEKYDWYIRCNISCYINIPILDKAFNAFDKNTVYCNSINSFINDEKYYNDLYPRGDFMIFSRETREGILKVAPQFIRCDYAMKNRLNIPHVDDCMFGMCIMTYFGENYYNHLKALYYNYIPSYKKEEEYVWSKDYIATRVKTIPPGINFSGYSWDDNEFREIDVYKMEKINEVVKNTDYSKKVLQFKDLLNTSKPIIFISTTFARIETFLTYLKTKKRGS